MQVQTLEEEVLLAFSRRLLGGDSLVLPEEQNACRLDESLQQSSETSHWSLHKNGSIGCPSVLTPTSRMQGNILAGRRQQL